MFRNSLFSPSSFILVSLPRLPPSWMVPLSIARCSPIIHKSESYILCHCLCILEEFTQIVFHFINPFSAHFLNSAQAGLLLWISHSSGVMGHLRKKVETIQDINCFHCSKCWFPHLSFPKRGKSRALSSQVNWTAWVLPRRIIRGPSPGWNWSPATFQSELGPKEEWFPSCDTFRD